MQLNNTNGKVIKLDKIDVNQNRIVYSVYEYGGGNFLKQISYVFTSIKLKDYLNQEINFTNFCYEKLAEEKEKDYTISEDTQNWLHIEKPIRVMIDNSMSTKEMVDNVAYKTLMDVMLDVHKGFIKVGEKQTIIYVSTLDPEEMVVIADFVGVWIFTENKNN